MRLLHWTFVTCVAGAWLTRGAQAADLHAVFGYVALAALLCRVAWGFAGPVHARFASFAYSPREAWRYLRAAFRGAVPHYTGHNPAGSWSVWLLLALLALACITGVVASAGMHGMGPLSGSVSWALGDAAFEWHELVAWAVLATVALHLLGVAWGSYLHRENLALAMVTGRKVQHDAHPEPRARSGPAVALAALFVIGSASYLFWHVPQEVAAGTRLAESASRGLARKPWTRECGSCHLAYPPELLPLRSWQRTLDEQDRHFGEDLSLSEASIRRLLDEARTPASSWATWKIASSVAPSSAPLRVTELPAWVRMHARMPQERFKPPAAAGPHECEACHRDAASGIFHARMIQSTKPRNNP